MILGLFLKENLEESPGIRSQILRRINPLRLPNETRPGAVPDPVPGINGTNWECAARSVRAFPGGASSGKTGGGLGATGRGLGRTGGGLGLDRAGLGILSWERTGRGLGADWQPSGSGLGRNGAGLELVWDRTGLRLNGTGTRLEADWERTGPDWDWTGDGSGADWD